MADKPKNRRPLASDRDFVQTLQGLPEGQHTIYVQPDSFLLKREGSSNYRPPGPPYVWLTVVKS